MNFCFEAIKFYSACICFCFGMIISMSFFYFVFGTLLFQLNSQGSGYCLGIAIRPDIFSWGLYNLFKGIFQFNDNTIKGDIPPNSYNNPNQFSMNSETFYETYLKYNNINGNTNFYEKKSPYMIILKDAGKMIWKHKKLISFITLVLVGLYLKSKEDNAFRARTETNQATQLITNQEQNPGLDNQAPTSLNNPQSLTLNIGSNAYASTSTNPNPPNDNQTYHTNYLNSNDTHEFNLTKIDLARKLEAQGLPRPFIHETMHNRGYMNWFFDQRITRIINEREQYRNLYHRAMDIVESVTHTGSDITDHSSSSGNLAISVPHNHPNSGNNLPEGLPLIQRDNSPRN